MTPTRCVGCATTHTALRCPVRSNLQRSEAPPTSDNGEINLPIPTRELSIKPCQIYSEADADQFAYRKDPKKSKHSARSSAVNKQAIMVERFLRTLKIHTVQLSIDCWDSSKSTASSFPPKLRNKKAKRIFQEPRVCAAA